MTTITARLIAVTQPTTETKASYPEDVVSYCARVSNPSNQENFDTTKKLLKYCMDNNHWSVFEMASAIVEVRAPRDITRQLLRHRSFSFQEFSQRYSDQIEFTDREFRRQDTKNRQNSVDDLGNKQEYQEITKSFLYEIQSEYKYMLKEGVAKECARVILPEGLTMSTLYVNGTLRSWIHYLNVREGNGTQKEHTILANKIHEVLKPAFPAVFDMLESR